MRNTCSESDCDRQAFGKGLCSKHYQLARYHGALPGDPPPRICPQCRDTFTSRKWNATYCSRKCNDAAAYERNHVEHRRAETCENCGGSMAGRRHHARFCSDTCGDAWRNARRQESLVASRSDRACKGCLTVIPASVRGSRVYCTEACKIRSRRHEAYGLTHVELQTLLEQHERCAICRTDAWGKKGPQVDHDHATGRVRGVLCSNCNQGLGRFRDDPDLLRAAIAYLS